MVEAINEISTGLVQEPVWTMGSKLESWFCPFHYRFTVRNDCLHHNIYDYYTAVC